LCLFILDNIGITFPWTGFFIIGKGYYYDHFAGVLSIPVDAAFEVDKYFGLFHELGHIIISRNKIYFEDEIESLDNGAFDDIYELRTEIFCDLFDFRCGFLGHYELYMNSIPFYLANLINRKQVPYKKIEEYVLRLLLVTLYSNNFYRLENMEKISKDLLEDFLRKGKITMTPDEKGEVLKNIHYTAAALKNSLTHFRKFFDEFFSDFCRTRESKFESHLFKSQFKRILDGEVVSGVEHPQLIVLAMIKEKTRKKSIPFKAHVAAIQSFLYHYYQHGWDNSPKFYK
jgi:hypothetical protein